MYWRLLQEADRHVAVQVAHVNTKGVVGSGFPTKKDSPYCKHGWNFNVLQHNGASLLKCLGPISGELATCSQRTVWFSNAKRIVVSFDEFTI